METFNEAHEGLILGKEWLVKVDNDNSIPYLMKFSISEDNSTCCLLITDTKTTWAEVLTSKQMLRRWRECNPELVLISGDEGRSQLHNILNLLHSPAGISDASFDVVGSRDADLAFELDCQEFKWRWDTYLQGPKTSSHIISKQLILPLISMTHVAFYSADLISELEEKDLEKTIDKVGRTARRSLDTHVKHTFSRPRVVTSLQRVTALLNLSHVLPSISSEVEPPVWKEHISELRARTESSSAENESALTRAGPSRDMTKPVDIPQPRAMEAKDSDPAPWDATVSTKANENAVVPRHSLVSEADSATESDSGEELQEEELALNDKPSTAFPEATKSSHPAPDVGEPGPSRVQRRTSPLPNSSPKSEASPPSKRLKPRTTQSSDSDSDSDTGAKGRSQGASRGGRGASRGVRQPMKRGAKRF